MMAARDLVGVRSIIVCNAVFAICMAVSLGYFAHHCWQNADSLSGASAARFAFVFFEKAAAVVFFLLATVIYCRLWSLYRYSNRNLKRRLIEVLPAAFSAVFMVIIMYLGLFYKKSEFEVYVWATFT